VTRGQESKGEGYWKEEEKKKKKKKKPHSTTNDQNSEPKFEIIDFLRTYSR